MKAASTTTTTPKKATKTAASTTTKTPKKATKKSWDTKPTISWENSRGQVLCRTGKRGAGETTSFKFVKARAKAEACLKGMMADYTRHGLGLQ